MNDLALALLDHLDLSVAVVRGDGVIVYRNVAFDKIFGTSASSWIASASRAVAGVRGWLQGFFMGGEVDSIDVEFGGRTYRVARLMMVPGEQPTVALSFEDVTSHREAEQAKSDFTSMIVHDLRGPLSGIQGTFEFILAEKGRLDQMQQDLLGEAFHESERMMGLINELLDFSKIQSGNFVVEEDPVPLAPLLKRAVKSLQSVAGRSDVLLVSAHGRDLPTVHGSMEKLTQAIINLISNSLKFTAAKGVISVSAKTVRDGDQIDVLVSVTDTGVGIKAEDIPNLFQKYKQTKSKSLRGGGGTGLGLYIVKQVIEAHGGTVEIASIAGVGTSMVLKLPVRKAA